MNKGKDPRAEPLKSLIKKVTALTDKLYKREEVELEEARKPAKDIGLECQECGKRFRSKNPRYGVT